MLALWCAVGCWCMKKTRFLHEVKNLEISKKTLDFSDYFSVVNIIDKLRYLLVICGVSKSLRAFKSSWS